jgi:molybdenum cofactor cytidylyltransferase
LGLLPFDGVPALRLVLDACQGLATPIVVLGKQAEIVQAAIPLEQGVINPDPSRGQTSSLKLGLSRAADAFLLFPADHPLITREDVAAVVKAFRPGSGRIVIPSFNKRRGHPVAFDRSIREEILALADHESVRTVINRNSDRIDYVNSESPGILMDMDTPEDYARCLEAYRARKRTS